MSHPLPAVVRRSMRFDPEGNTAAAHQHAAQQQQQSGYGGAAGNPYTQNGAAAYGGAPPGGAYGSPNGAANGNYANGNPYGGQTGAPYGGQTGGPYGGPTGPYGGPTGPYGGGATGGGHAAVSPIKLKDCSTPELLQHLPTIQKLLGRLMQCVPEGASAINPVILVSRAQIVFGWYAAGAVWWAERVGGRTGGMGKREVCLHMVLGRLMHCVPEGASAINPAHQSSW
jgi:hypothetical protein